MFDNLIQKLSRLLCKGKEEEDIEVVASGLGIIISLSILGVVILITALYFGKLIEAGLFCVVLLFLRRRIGGIHSKSYFHCMCLTYVTCFLAVGLNEIIQSYGSDLYSKLLLPIGALLILEFAPKDTENRKFDDEEKIIFRIKSLERLCFVILCSYFLGLFSQRLSGIIDMAVFIQGTVIIKKRRLLLWKRNLLKN
jgi:accessory gene regulator protein AgrB